MTRLPGHLTKGTRAIIRRTVVKQPTITRATYQVIVQCGKDSLRAKVVRAAIEQFLRAHPELFRARSTTENADA